MNTTRFEPCPLSRLIKAVCRNGARNRVVLVGTFLLPDPTSPSVGPVRRRATQAALVKPVWVQQIAIMSRDELKRERRASWPLPSTSPGCTAGSPKTFSDGSALAAYVQIEGRVVSRAARRMSGTVNRGVQYRICCDITSLLPAQAADGMHANAR